MDQDGDKIMHQEIIKGTPTNMKPSSPSSTEWRNQLTEEQRFIHETTVKTLRVIIGAKREGSKLLHLPQCTAFAVEDHQFPYFTEQMLEMALVERLSQHMVMEAQQQQQQQQNSSPVVYLMQCYRLAREALVREQNKNIGAKTSDATAQQQRKIDFLCSICRLVVDYVAHVLLNPDMFPQSQAIRQRGSLVLLPYFTQKSPGSLSSTSSTSGSGNTLPDNFLEELVKSLATRPDGLDRVFIPIFTEVRDQIKNLTALDRYIDVVNTLEKLTKNAELCKVLLRHEQWLAKTPLAFQNGALDHPTGQIVQQTSYLGPFFGVLSFFREKGFEKVNDTYFAHSVDRMTQSELNSIHTSLRMELDILQTTLHHIMHNLLAPRETRDCLLQWVAQVLVGNQTRTKMNPNMRIASSDGFLANFCAVMLRLCEPFLRQPASKFSSVNADFIMSNNLIDFGEETKIATSKSEAQEWYDQNRSTATEENYNFVTQCFFMTYQALRVGTLKSVDVYLNAMQELHKLQKQIQRAQMGGGVSDFDLQMMKRAMREGLLYRFGAETVLVDPKTMKSTLSFYRFSSYWLMRLADTNQRGPPLPPPVPPCFGVMPEYFIENISRYILFLTRVYPEGLAEGSLDEIFNMMVYFVGNGQYVKNPYVRANFPEIIASFTPEENKYMPESLSNMVFRHDLMKQHLMGGIMQLYVDLEHTGESHQFYSKFNYRYHISVLLRYLWNDEAYKRSFAQVCQETESHHVEFVKFFNMLLNDMTYLLEESLEKLTEIRHIQQEQANRTAWNALSRQDREQRESNFQLAERITKSSMLLARENANMIRYLSRDIPEPFMRPELVEKVAGMLNSFVEKLAGPRCQELKVDNMDKYHFDPKELLTYVTDAFINFSKFDQFVDAVARDERYFKPKVFNAVAYILQRKLGKPMPYVQQFRSFTERVIEKVDELSAMEEDFGEVPDEFLDEIFYTLMSDPVQLPSGQLVDRSTLERHLLNDPTNPFTRAPLSMEECSSDTALKQRIEEWKAEKRKEKMSD